MKPTINSLFSRRETPDNLWQKCPECGTMLFHRELAENLNVCINCDHHMYIGPAERLADLYDNSAFQLLEYDAPIADPLKFRDQKKYYSFVSLKINDTTNYDYQFKIFREGTERYTEIKKLDIDVQTDIDADWDEDFSYPLNGPFTVKLDKMYPPGGVPITIPENDQAIVEISWEGYNLFRPDAGPGSQNEVRYKGPNLLIFSNLKEKAKCISLEKYFSKYIFLQKKIILYF